MFDFEKLDVYVKAKQFNSEVRQFLKDKPVDRTLNNQFRRASLSIVLNIAEGTGRFTNPDKRNFYVIARSSVFECVAILDILKDDHHLTRQEFSSFYKSGEELSKMLFAMVRRLE